MKYESSIWDQNPNKYLKECKRIRSLSKRLMEGQISLFDAQEKFNQYQFWLKQQANPDFAVFSKISEEKGNLPVGEVRNLWNSQALAKADIKLAKIEEKYKSLALESANNIFQKYDSIIKKIISNKSLV